MSKLIHKRPVVAETEVGGTPGGGSERAIEANRT